MAHAKFVKSARKADKEAGIKVGDSYYWWKFRFGGIHKSKTAPKQSQLTQSEFLSTIYEIQERFEDLDPSNLEDAVSTRDIAVDDLRSLADEQSEKRDNMPESLQDGTVGQLLEDRETNVNDYADELEAVDLDIEQEEGESEEDFNSKIEDAINELQSASYNGE